MTAAVSMLLGLHAETSLHAGAGSAMDVVDLPIQREAHTGYPVIFASSLKGALRSAASSRGQGDPSPEVTALFGPRAAEGDQAHAGALMVGDARLLALPVRSLSGHFKWVTCPYLVHRLRRDIQRLSLTLPEVPSLPTIEAGNALSSRGDGRLFLEEYAFTLQSHPALEALVGVVARLTAVEGMRERLSQQLVVVNDDEFSHLSRAAVPVTPHVALDPQTKTALKGALWYEETLPPETLLYAPLVANAGRGGSKEFSASDCVRHFESYFASQPYLQVGGNETVGMGWCQVTLVKASH